MPGEVESEEEGSYGYYLIPIIMLFFNNVLNHHRPVWYFQWNQKPITLSPSPLTIQTFFFNNNGQKKNTQNSNQKTMAQNSINLTFFLFRPVLLHRNISTIGIKNMYTIIFVMPTVCFPQQRLFWIWKQKL